jgi:hypothetical protein
MKNLESFYCEECGLIGFKNLPDDIAGHKKWHQILIKGFVTRRTVNDYIIWENKDYWITEVNATSKLIQRKKAEKVSRAIPKAIWQEDFSYNSYNAKDTTNASDLHLFLIHHKQRVVGLIVTKKKQCLEARWNGDMPLLTKKITEKPIVVIEMIWLAVSYRKKGVAKRSIFAVAQYFSLEPKSFGWSLPFSASGGHLAKSISPTMVHVYSDGI